jgi:hypothetical protein
MSTFENGTPLREFSRFSAFSETCLQEAEAHSTGTTRLPDHALIDRLIISYEVNNVGVCLATRANTTRNAYFDEERRRGGNCLVTCCDRNDSS